MYLHLNSLSQLGRLSLAFVLTYLLGFERDLRGSTAGDRTSSLIGVGSAIIAVLAKDGAYSCFDDAPCHGHST